MRCKTVYYSLAIVTLIAAAVLVNLKHIQALITPKPASDAYVAKFTDIYDGNHWGKGSGVGSNPTNAAEYISLLQSYFDDPRFNTFVDLGCGDWQIMSQIKIPVNKTYIGYDVVASVIDSNKQRFAAHNVHFYTIKDLREFKTNGKSADLLIVKDVLQHWPNQEIQYFILNILPDYKFALITNAYFNDPRRVNTDINLGGFRALDLAAVPFGLQDTIQVLNYKGPETKQVLLYANHKFIS